MFHTCLCVQVSHTEPGRREGSKVLSRNDKKQSVDERREGSQVTGERRDMSEAPQVLSRNNKRQSVDERQYVSQAPQV